MMKRDLKVDLELFNRATPGPWSTIDRLNKYVTNTGEVKSFTREQFIQSEQETICTTYKPKNKHNAEFIAEAREGWPHAIERAIKAEALVRELMGVLEGVQRLKPLIAYPDDVLPEFEEEAIAIAHMLKTIDSVVIKAKEVLGDE